MCADASGQAAADAVTPRHREKRTPLMQELGRLEDLPQDYRDELKELIERNGGKVGSSVSSKTTYLVAGANMGPAKLKTATSLGVVILSEDEFIKLIS